MKILITESQLKSIKNNIEQSLDEQKLTLESEIKGYIERNIDEVLGDEIPGYMKNIIQKRYADSEKYLSMDIPKHNEIIPNIQVEIDDVNITKKTINELIEYFLTNIFIQFEETKIYKLLIKSDIIRMLFQKSLDESFNFDDLTSREKIEKIIRLYKKDFLLLASKDNNIRNPKFSNNKSGVANFLTSIKKAFPDIEIDVNSIIQDKHFVGLREPILNYITNLNKILGSKLYLYISDKPDDKLRMSISLFYDSCQNIYTGGDQGSQYNKKLLSNVFDENSKVAYLMFNSPFTDKKGNVHPFSSIARTIIRVNNEGGVMFDKVYPNDMEEIFYKIIEDKTGLKNVGKKDDVYHYKGIGLPPPYMDKYSLKNTGQSDWNDRIAALIEITGAEVGDISEISENRFSIGAEVWEVFPYDDAIERTRDYLRDSFYDLFSGNYFIQIINNGLLDSDEVKKILGFDDEMKEELGLKDFDDYITEFTEIKTLVDFNNILKKKLNNWSSWQWYNSNVNIESVIDYFGGETEAMNFTLPSEDGIIYESSERYIIYRTNS